MQTIRSIATLSKFLKARRYISSIYGSVPDAVPSTMLDGRLVFNERKHAYKYSGYPCVSITSYISSLFPRFDANAIIEAYYDRWQQDPNSKYFGLDPEAIKALWSSSGAKAIRLGTLLHGFIEAFFRGKSFDKAGLVGDDVVQQFLKFHDRFGPFSKVTPERKLVHPSLLMAGTVDLIANGSSPNSVTIYDWKRSSKILSSDAQFFGKYCLAPGLEHLPDTSFTKYTLQLNLYKYMLENTYRIKVEEMNLVQFCDDADYIVTPIDELDEEVNVIVEKRKSFVAATYGDIIHLNANN